MKQLKSVFLLVGPRGSGKSCYAKKLAENQPGLIVVSRDEIFVRLFGTVYPNSIYGANEGADEVDRVLREKLDGDNVKILLDHWAGTEDLRRDLIERLRRFGADRIIAPLFTTPKELVVKWFWEKPEIGKLKDAGTIKGPNVAFFKDDEPEIEYQHFQRHIGHIDLEGFDQVIRVDPTTNTIDLY